MLLYVKDGLLPKPDVVIHADTGSEMPETVEHVHNWAIPFCEDLGIDFRIVRSHRGTIYDDYFQAGTIPVIGFRSCTDNFKIMPQRREIRKIVGQGKRGELLASCWLGITTDEERRRTDSSVKWCSISYPLLDDYRVSRADCLDRLQLEGLDVIKSGCFHCPYAGSNFYRSLRESHPDLFEKAILLEANAERRILERTGKELRSGLVWGKKLRLLDDYHVDDATCDSGAGCFI